MKTDSTFSDKIAALLGFAKTVSLVKERNGTYWVRFTDSYGPTALCGTDFTEVMERAYCIAEINHRSNEKYKNEPQGNIRKE